MHKNKAKGTRLETRAVAEAKKHHLPARKQPLSGQLRDFPEDVVVGRFLFQCKAGYTRVSKDGIRTFSFRKAWLDQVRAAAKAQGYRFGAVLFRPDGTNQLFVTLDYTDFLHLVEVDDDRSGISINRPITSQEALPHQPTSSHPDSSRGDGSRR